MNGYDSWLESPFQEQCIKDDWIEQETWDILAKEKHLVTLFSLCEAISEDALYLKKPEIEAALDNMDYAKLGQLIYHANLDYWEKIAEKQAQLNWEDEI
jgi:hypothetical protein